MELPQPLEITVLNSVPINHSQKLFNLHVTTLSRRILMYKSFHQELWRSRKVVRMDVLREYCVINVVKKATMPMGAQ